MSGTPPSPVDDGDLEPDAERAGREAELRPVRFHTVAEWQPLPYRRDEVQIAFRERLVVQAERNGPDNHARIVPAEKFLDDTGPWLAEHGWEWLAAYISRLAAGEDIETELLERVRRETGEEPKTTDWRIDPGAYRRLR